MRRAPLVTSYWVDGELLTENPATGLGCVTPPSLMKLLDLCGDWRTVSELQARVPPDERSLVPSYVKYLLAYSLLETFGSAVPQASWPDGWTAAARFHLATKNASYADPVQFDRALRAKARRHPPPAAIKAVRASARLALPAPALDGDLSSTLLSRRTWRRFSTRPVPVRDLATLLGFTWGVQAWMHVPGIGPTPLKTSPSGGARHSLEAYVFARHVTGLKRGIYHYEPERHELAWLRATPGRRRISDYVPRQHWYDDAAAVVFMTSIFGRAQWRYPHARHYRSILAEAGHFCQTFCLIATRLGLAPFCTMAFADAIVERDLGVDGLSESVIYAAGVGARPEGVTWAPWPEPDATPERSAPTRGRRTR